jgi:hypothetical protein
MRTENAEPRHSDDPTKSERATHAAGRRLLLASVAALYFELVVIRYVGAEVRVFTNLKNIPLIACFFGLGLGMILGTRRKLLFLFPVIGLFLFCVTRYAQPLHLADVDLLWTYDLAQNVAANLGHRMLSTVRFLGLVLAFCALMVSFFVVLGGLIGEPLKQVPGLRGYGANLAGSLAGALMFSAVAFLNLGPAVWLLVGFGLLLPLVRGKWPVVLFLLTVAAVAKPERGTFWSPYSRIDVVPLPPPAGSNEVAAYSIVANHLWHQWAANLSPAFLEKYPRAIPNSVIAPFADIVYRLAPSGKRAGAGGWNWERCGWSVAARRSARGRGRRLIRRSWRSENAFIRSIRMIPRG